ncbi:MAG: hypothetical protein AB7L84_13715 [Acidimicrobiia bacterium]
MARFWPALVVAVVGVLGAGACSGGDGADDADEAVGLSTTTVPVVPAPLAPAAAGAGVVRLGGDELELAVTACAPEGDPTQPEAARPLFTLAGEGTTAAGQAFTVSVQRFVTGVTVRTFTDTITYEDPGQVLQAQRVEVNGVVTDLRDAAARTPLLQIRAGGVAAQGLAGPPGSAAGMPGLVGLALDASCT